MGRKRSFGSGKNRTAVSAVQTSGKPALPDEMESAPECDDSFGPDNDPGIDGPIHMSSIETGEGEIGSRNPTLGARRGGQDPVNPVALAKPREK